MPKQNMISHNVTSNQTENSQNVKDNIYILKCSNKCDVQNTNKQS